ASASTATNSPQRSRDSPSSRTRSTNVSEPRHSYGRRTMSRRSDNAILTALFLATAISIVLAVILNMPGEELAMHGVDNQPAQAAQAAQATEIRNIVELLQPTPTRVPSSTPTPRPRQTHEPTETPLPTFALGGTPEPGLYRIVPPTQ